MITDDLAITIFFLVIVVVDATIANAEDRILGLVQCLFASTMIGNLVRILWPLLTKN